MRGTWILVGLALGCLREAKPLRCDALGDGACNLHAGARCVEGYCARPVAASECASGWRYTESSAQPGVCTRARLDGGEDVPSPVDASDASDDTRAPLDTSAPVDTGNHGDTGLPMDTGGPRDTGPLADTGSPVDVPRDTGVDVPVDAPLAVPRQVTPLSTSRVMTPRPTLRWSLPPAGAAVRLQLCRTAGCSIVEGEYTTAGDLFVVSLTPGLYWWRIRSEAGGRASAYSPSWQLRVVLRRSPRDVGWGTTGDLDGDGLAEHLVGDGATVPPGRVTMFRSRPGATLDLAGSALVVPETVRTTGYFGASIAMAGDVDGDGYGDVVVGVTGRPTGNPGRVLLYRGGASGLGLTAAQELRTASRSPSFGAAVAGVGDVDLDGYADVAVGDPDLEEISVSHGSATGLGEPMLYLAGAGLGRGIANGVDLNGDGRGDVVATQGNLLRVRFGGSAPVLMATFSELVAGQGFGANLWPSVDLNGDGLSEVVVLVGSQVNVIYGASAAVLGAAMPLPLNAPSSAGVRAVIGLPDCNGDGTDDLAVLRSELNTLLVYAGTSGLPARDATISADLGAFSGVTFFGPGDLSGDNLSDVVAWNHTLGRGLVFPSESLRGGLLEGTAITLSAGFGRVLAARPPAPSRARGPRLAAR